VCYFGAFAFDVYWACFDIFYTSGEQMKQAAPFVEYAAFWGILNRITTGQQQRFVQACGTSFSGNVICNISSQGNGGFFVYAAKAMLQQYATSLAGIASKFALCWLGS
jgi:hypothetical protein